MPAISLILLSYLSTTLLLLGFDKSLQLPRRISLNGDIFKQNIRESSTEDVRRALDRCGGRPPLGAGGRRTDPGGHGSSTVDGATSVGKATGRPPLWRADVGYNLIFFPTLYILLVQLHFIRTTCIYKFLSLYIHFFWRNMLHYDSDSPITSESQMQNISSPCIPSRFGKNASGSAPMSGMMPGVSTMIQQPQLGG